MVAKGLSDLPRRKKCAAGLPDSSNEGASAASPGGDAPLSSVHNKTTFPCPQKEEAHHPFPFAPPRDA